MNKSTLEQMKRKDSMVKRHINMQDSDISKLKQKVSEQEKSIKALRDDIQVINDIYFFYSSFSNICSSRPKL